MRLPSCLKCGFSFLDFLSLRVLRALIEHVVAVKVPLRVWLAFLAVLLVGKVSGVGLISCVRAVLPPQILRFPSDSEVACTAILPT